MGAWLFQGNPDTFDIDAYVANHNTISWAVRQEHLASEMQPGDRVYFWRAAGAARRSSGIVASGRLLGAPERRSDDADALAYWQDPTEARAERLRVQVELDASAGSHLLGKGILLADPELAKLRILRLRNETNYRLTDDESARLEELWRDARAERPTAWLLITLDDEDRQHAGNAGYEDDVENVYRFDSKVPNHRQLKAGDFAVLRSSSDLLGVARIARLESAEGTKTLRRCPECRRTSLKPRKTRRPRYRCDQCKAEFDEPETEEVPVTKYAAHFDGSFVGTPGAATIAELRAACPNYNGQLAMQRIDLDRVLTQLSEVNADVRDLLLGAVPSPDDGLTAKALLRAAEDADSAGDFDPHSTEDAREKALCAITQRRGQLRFREALRAAYGGRCAVSGCDVEEALEAAHIVRYNGKQTNHVQNGLLLRADIHTLFDCDLIAVDTERWTVILHPSLRASSYAEYHDRPLTVPDLEALRPNQEALESRRRRAGF